MGYLTTITIYNDALDTFEKHPKEFAEAVFEGIRNASRVHKKVSVGFKGYANYISVQPSFHADEHQLYLHSGNTVFNLNPWRDDMAELIERSPDLAQEMITRAQKMLTEAKKKVKVVKSKRNENSRH